MYQQGKSRQRKQAMRKLIVATEQVIDREGIDAVTIRKVSQISGMNSALIYNYFEDLSQLVYYALIGYLKDYNSALAQNVRPTDDAKEQIMQVFEIFCQYAFQIEPEIYYTLFFSKYSRHLAEIQWEYYNIFEIDLPLHGNSTIDKMIRSDSVSGRNNVLLEQLVLSGQLSQQQSQIINLLIIYAQQSLLYNKLVGVNRDTAEESTKELMAIIRFLLGTE